MLYIVDCFKIKYSSIGNEDIDYTCLETIDFEHQTHEKQGGHCTQHSIVCEEGLLLLLLHFVHTLVRSEEGLEEELVNIVALDGTRRVLGSCNFPVMPIKMLVGEVHIQVLDHMEGA